METQWEQATKQLNENVMHQQIEHLNVQLTKSNQEIIRLKQENQVLKLQNNMINPADQASQGKSDLMREEFKRQVEELQTKLNRVERQKAEE